MISPAVAIYIAGAQGGRGLPGYPHPSIDNLKPKVQKKKGEI